MLFLQLLLLKAGFSHPHPPPEVQRTVSNRANVNRAFRSYLSPFLQIALVLSVSVSVFLWRAPVLPMSVNVFLWRVLVLPVSLKVFLGQFQCCPCW